MTPLQFSGSPWFLLLLAPGLYILWRQYRGGAGRGPAIPLLQAAALLLLVVSLTGPEWVRRHADFHNPSILILRDLSGSFQAGGYLGLGEDYAKAEAAIAAGYRARRFDVLTADFHERAWPVSGFRGKGASAPEAGRTDTPLTSLAGAADFLDSAASAASGLRNLQAVFLFSDGRANLDSGKASRTWPVPVYPVLLPVRKVSEVQPERVGWTADQGGREGLEVAWTPVGPPAGARIQVLQGGRTVFSADLPAGEGEDLRTARLPWKPDPGAAKPEGLRAVIRPAGGLDNFDPFNDTLAVSAAAGRGGRRILILKPLRSLDEKGMVDLMHGWDEARVEMASREDLASRPLGAKDQIWVEAGALAGRADLLKALRETPAKVIAYARPGGLPEALAGVRVRGQEFSPSSEVRPSRAAADVFPDAVVRLRSVAARSLQVPAAEAPWREAAVLLEGGRRGLLMGWFPLGPGKDGFFLALPPLWELLFDPQADFATRENLELVLRAASLLAERQEGAVKAVRPRRAYAGIPFDLEFTVPPAGGKPAGSLEVAALLGGRRAESWTAAGPGPEVFRLEGRTLPAGAWELELLRAGERLWRDSLQVAPKASLELSRIGFDRAALQDLASQSGGRVIAPDPAGRETGVSSLLPDLAGAQVKAERVRTVRLYNTRWLFLLAVALLTASWLLRKRWDLD